MEALVLEGHQLPVVIEGFKHTSGLLPWHFEL